MVAPHSAMKMEYTLPDRCHTHYFKSVQWKEKRSDNVGRHDGVGTAMPRACSTRKLVILYKHAFDLALGVKRDDKEERG
jgi:hypothetical protein